MATTPIFERKNVLVTGGAGFIGSHLCEQLLEEAKVICVDNFLLGTLDNIEHLLQHPNFVFIRHDINEPLELEKLPELEKFKIQFQGVQEIYHLACPTSPKDFDQYRLETLKVNSIGTLRVLDLASRYKARTVIASSSVVYGPRERTGDAFVKEDHLGLVNHLSPRGCYDEGKRWVETQGATYRDFYGIDVRTARIFRTYGPRVKLGIGEMVPDFIMNALDNKDLVIYGAKEFRTTLCFVTDIVDGLKKLMAAESDPGVVNIGADEDMQLSSVAEKIIELTQSSSKISYVAPLMFMTELPLPDITRAKETLQWFPIVRLEDGLRRMIDWAIARRTRLG